MNEIQNELAGATVALGATITAAMDDAPGFVPCGTPAQVVLDALLGFAASANAETLSQDATSWLYRSLAALETGDDEKVGTQLAAAPRA